MSLPVSRPSEASTPTQGSKTHTSGVDGGRRLTAAELLNEWAFEEIQRLRADYNAQLGRSLSFIKGITG